MAYREPNISRHAQGSLKDLRDSASKALIVGGSAMAIAGIWNPPLAAVGFTAAAAGEVLKVIPVPTPQHAFAR